MIKSSIEFLETSLFSNPEHLLFFVSPNGIIFISNQPSYRFQLLWPVDNKTMDRIVNSRQFGNGPWDWSGFSKTKNQDRVVDRNQQEFLYTSLPVPAYPLWQVVSLKNKNSLKKNCPLRLSKDRARGDFYFMPGRDSGFFPLSAGSQRNQPAKSCGRKAADQ